MISRRVCKQSPNRCVVACQRRSNDEKEWALFNCWAMCIIHFYSERLSGMGQTIPSNILQLHRSGINELARVFPRVLQLSQVQSKKSKRSSLSTDLITKRVPFSFESSDASGWSLFVITYPQIPKNQWKNLNLPPGPSRHPFYFHQESLGRIGCCWQRPIFARGSSNLALLKKRFSVRQRLSPFFDRWSFQFQKLDQPSWLSFLFFSHFRRIHLTHIGQKFRRRHEISWMEEFGESEK